MALALFPFLAFGGALAVFLALFAVASAREKEPRALRVSVLGAAAPVVVWGGAVILHLPAGAYWAVDGILALFALLYFLPLGRTRAIAAQGPAPRVDERTVMFSREDYLPGDGRYESYYAEHPEHKDLDDRIRRLPELLAPGGLFYDPMVSPHVDAIFDVVEDLTPMVDGPVAARRDDAPSPDPARMTGQLGELIRRLGADEVGVARLNPSWVYSHVGRGPESWGRPIELDHRFALVFSLEMDHEAVRGAPGLSVTAESARRYLDESMIAIAVARHIRALGYPARAHVSGSNYQVMLPPLACDAGLGELGRHGYFISRRLGTRVRLGAVTTDLPLTPAAPVSTGVREFCGICRRCADSCPAGAIPHGPPGLARGVEKWSMKQESCLHYWRVLGTDCGLCMRMCPFGHADSFVHRVVRLAVARSAFARRLSMWGEELFYGRTRRRRFCNISSDLGGGSGLA